ncbi:MAG: response regulator [Planctomycetes bacterium]|nr:response regulator [Planctomycetota bacterium]
MLVLARHENETIVFPSLGVTVEVLRIRGGSTKIGIEAPADVPIKRGELLGLKSLQFTADEPSPPERLRRLRQAVRRRLDETAIQLNDLHRQLEEGDREQAEEAILRIFRELESLEREAFDDLRQGAGGKEPSHSRLPRHALVVEDDRDQRELMAGLFRLSGYDVTTAADGADALDFLSLHAAPDAIVLDMRMPRCDGPTMVRQIRCDPKFRGVKLFAVSGAEPGSLGVKLGPEGVDRWFPKPVQPEQLLEEVTRVLANH